MPSTPKRIDREYEELFGYVTFTIDGRHFVVVTNPKQAEAELGLLWRERYPAHWAWWQSGDPVCLDSSSMGVWIRLR